MMYRIVKRAFSEYTDIEVFKGGCIGAVLRAMELEFANKDGEYLVRGIDEPNWTPVDNTAVTYDT